MTITCVGFYLISQNADYEHVDADQSISLEWNTVSFPLIFLSLCAENFHKL